MAYVYKQFTAQDKALIPFNAHKQYDFGNVSALNNSASYYSSRWTSESYDIYSGTGSREDVINVIKYNQIDKLYYRNYLSQIHDKLGPIEYIKQPRNLYEKANILSIPMGLYGNQIKPGSFYLKTNNYNIIDDKFGNLLISGSGDRHNPNYYPNNIQESVFRLDPIKGFKKYDLGVHEGYTTIAELPAPPATQGTEYLPLHYYQKNYEKNRWRRGTRIDYNSPTTFTSGQRKPLKFYPLDKDDSYFRNNIHYYNIAFNTSSLGSNAHKFPKILFRSNTGSLISSSHDENFNFNGDEDFSLSFWIRPYPVVTVGKGIGFAAVIGSNDKDNILTVGTGNFTAKKITDNEKRYILSKSKTKRVHSHHIKDFANNPISGLPMKDYSKEVPSEIQFPYEIYMQSSSLSFAMSDGNETKTITAEISSSNTSSINRTSHILCQHSGSTMEIYFDGNKILSTPTSFKDPTRNTADLYIGGNGSSNNLDNNGGVGISAIENGFSIGNYISGSVEGPKYFNGDISNINIWSRAYNSTFINNISESINGSPYIGNLFYQNGFATITHPTYYSALNSVGIGNMMIEATDNSDPFIVDDSLGILQFQGTHLIYENEYQCTVGEHEFNDTKNISARKLKSTNSHELADFTTSSLFKPHVTTVGLYDDNMELLVVGKLGQPVRMSDETDTTFVLRWDT
tara:strand:- start:1340 stop:3388 length:2049 start_codon:yes stop_codon:yes gene_type:complete